MPLFNHVVSFIYIFLSMDTKKNPYQNVNNNSKN